MGGLRSDKQRRRLCQTHIHSQKNCGCFFPPSALVATVSLCLLPSALLRVCVISSPVAKHTYTHAHSAHITDSNSADRCWYLQLHIKDTQTGLVSIHKSILQLEDIDLQFVFMMDPDGSSNVTMDISVPSE